MQRLMGAAVLALILSAPRAEAANGCDAFLDKLRAEAADLQIDFTHAVVVSRAHSDTEVFDVTTKSDVDGTLTCRKDRMVRFEVHVSEPASARANAGFDKFADAAVRVALGWDAANARSTMKSMVSDAKDYYAASKERGDVYVAGKTEEHAPGGVSLGLILTDVDRAFIIVTGGS